MNFVELPLKYENGQYIVLNEKDDFDKGGFYINKDLIETIDIDNKKGRIDIFMKNRAILIKGNFEEISSIVALLDIEKYKDA